MPPATPPAAPSHSLSHEIQIIRDVILWVMKYSDEDIGLGERLKLLDSVSMASTRLATLLKTDAQLAKKEDLTDALNRVLAELLDEMEPDSPGRG